MSDLLAFLVGLGVGLAALGLIVWLGRRGAVPSGRDCVLDSMREAVVALDDAGRVIDLNRAAEGLLGVSRAQSIGHPLSALFPEMAPLIDELNRLLTASQEAVFFHAGLKREFEARAAPFLDRQGKAAGRVITLLDVSRRKAAEQSLQGSENTLLALLDASSEVAFLMDVHGNLLAFNEHLCRMVDRPREQVQGRNAFDLLPPDLAESRAVPIGRAISSGRPERWVDLFEGRLMDNSVYPVANAQGGVEKVAYFLRDITEDRLAEQTMLALLNASSEVAFLMDVHGNLLAFNEHLCRMVGRPREQVQGRNAFDLLPPDLAESRAVPIGRTISTGRPERWVDLYDGRYMDNSVYPVVNAQGGVEKVAFFIQDITDFKQAEETIRQSALALEARNRDLDAFARTVAHDLKKPLQGIIGYGGLIQMDFSDLSPDLRVFIDSIMESAGQMVEMIDSLLLMARLRDAQEVLGPVDLNGVVRDALHRFEQDIPARGIQMSVDEGLPAVLGYGPWLEEVLANLIGNAIKYIGRANPAPAIAVRARQENGRVRCEVQDNGLGISPDSQKRLFEQFARFHHAEASGTGLGLSIVKRIVEKMGGQVGVESAPGTGSTFWFILPAVENQPAQDQAVEGQPAA